MNEEATKKSPLSVTIIKATFAVVWLGLLAWNVLVNEGVTYWQNLTLLCIGTTLAAVFLPMLEERMKK